MAINHDAVGATSEPFTTTTTQPIRIETTDGIATVTLDRPERKNAVTFAMWRTLRDAFEDLAADPAVRVVVLTGAGDAFCSGADIRDPGYGGGDRSPAAGQARMRTIDSAAIALHRLAKPTIASVNGVAVGAGWSLALGCDIVLAAESARFSAMFIERGISLDLGGTWLFAHLAGLQLAKHLAFTGEFISAAEAADLGLVFRVHADADLAAATAAYAADLARRPRVALAQIKSGLNQATTWTFEQACEYEGHAQSACAAASAVRARRPTPKGDST
jgi:2-(1,2-epoxy-1,2-dihydrophenyl)acetyl-CoA isomerase